MDSKSSFGRCFLKIATAINSMQKLCMRRKELLKIPQLLVVKILLILHFRAERLGASEEHVRAGF